MIRKIKIRLNNLYLFRNKKGEYLLLDTGIKYDKDRLLSRIKRETGSINNIKVIVITHTHDDHTGNLKTLMEQLEKENITVICHSRGEKFILSGEKNIPGGFYPVTEFISKKIKEKIRKKGDIKKDEKDIIREEDKGKVLFTDINDCNELSLEKYGFDNIKLIYTPGHTMDSISLVYENSESTKDAGNREKYLFCGDAVQNIWRKWPLIPLFGDDIAVLKKTWRKIIDGKYGKIYPATGNYVTSEDLIKVLTKYEKNRV